MIRPTFFLTHLFVIETQFLMSVSCSHTRNGVLPSASLLVNFVLVLHHIAANGCFTMIGTVRSGRFDTRYRSSSK